MQNTLLKNINKENVTLAHNRSESIISFMAEKKDPHAMWLSATTFLPGMEAYNEQRSIEYLKMAAAANFPPAMIDYGEKLIFSPSSSHSERIDGWCLLVRACYFSNSAATRLIQNAQHFPFNTPVAAKCLISMLQKKSPFHMGLYALFEFIKLFRRMPAQGGTKHIASLVELAEKGGTATLKVALTAALFGTENKPLWSYFDRLESLVEKEDEKDCQFLFLLGSFLCDNIADGAQLPHSAHLTKLLALADTNHPGAVMLLASHKLNGHVPSSEIAGPRGVNQLVSFVVAAAQCNLPVCHILPTFRNKIVGMKSNELSELDCEKLKSLRNQSQCADLCVSLAYLYGFATFPDKDAVDSRNLESIECLKSAISAGDRGLCFLVAEGILKYDTIEAMYWFEAGLIGGEQKCFVKYGAYLIESGKRKGDKERGVSLLERAFSAGEFEAGRKLAEYYYNGTFLPQNQQEALRYAKICANCNDAEGMYLLGHYLYVGVCGVRNSTLGSYYLGKAHEAGYDLLSPFQLEVADAEAAEIKAATHTKGAEPVELQILTQEEVDALLNSVCENKGDPNFLGAQNEEAENAQLCRVIPIRWKS